jgi:hypothetical protein
MLTAEQKAKWLARLRDPSSKQYRGDYAKGPIDGAMCCIAHGHHAIAGDLHDTSQFSIFKEFE